MKNSFFVLLLTIAVSVLVFSTVLPTRHNIVLSAYAAEMGEDSAKEIGLESLEGVDDYTVTAPSPESVDTFMGRVGNAIRLVFRFIGSFFKELASIFIKGSSS